MAEDEYRDYIDKTLNPIMEDLIGEVVIEQPKDCLSFCINWMKKKRGDADTGSETEEKL